MVKTDCDQFSFNKVLIQKMKERMESPNKKGEQLNRNPSFI